ncbi:2-methylcitrate synthase [bacterium BMS3Abin05]|nr:2-methylcitrate synthase [bacterium BMS3Abin05]
MDDLHWKTAITEIAPNKINVRGYPVDELMGKISFSQAVYLILKGELPPKNVGKLLEAMLVSSIDHGATPPSTLAAITIASTGAPLNSALAGGILAISKWHGGAIEDCMKILREIDHLSDTQAITPEETADQLVRSYRDKRLKISGYGHRIHTRDPRSQKLFQLAGELNISGKYVKLAGALEKAIEKSLGKKLPINVDGAIATLLCELDFPPALANAFFIMARVPGMVAHIYEEQTRHKPMRKIHPADHEYNGPRERHLN